jgi:hypothetical protein
LPNKNKAHCGAASAAFQLADFHPVAADPKEAPRRPLEDPWRTPGWPLEGPLEGPLKGPLENDGATDTGRSFFLYEAAAEAEAEPPRQPSDLASGLGRAGLRVCWMKG